MFHISHCEHLILPDVHKKTHLDSSDSSGSTGQTIVPAVQGVHILKVSFCASSAS